MLTEPINQRTFHEKFHAIDEVKKHKTNVWQLFLLLRLVANLHTTHTHNRKLYHFLLPRYSIAPIDVASGPVVVWPIDVQSCIACCHPYLCHNNNIRWHWFEGIGFVCFYFVFCCGLTLEFMWFWFAVTCACFSSGYDSKCKCRHQWKMCTETKICDTVLVSCVTFPHSSHSQLFFCVADEQASLTLMQARFLFRK